MLYLVNTKTHEIIRDASGAVIVFSTNNAACNYAGTLGIPCWVESQVYNPGLNRRK
jgi:hypothetical protein